MLPIEITGAPQLLTDDALELLVAVDDVDTARLLALVVTELEVELEITELLERLVLIEAAIDEVAEELVDELLLLERDEDELVAALVDEPIPGANTEKL